MCDSCESPVWIYFKVADVFLRNRISEQVPIKFLLFYPHVCYLVGHTYAQMHDP